MKKTVKIFLLLVGIIAIIGSASLLLSAAKNQLAKSGNGIFTKTSRAETTNYITETWGNVGEVQYSGTLKVTSQTNFKFDLSALPSNTAINRSILRVKRKTGSPWGTSVKINPLVNGTEQDSLAVRAPFYDNLDATSAVKQWVSSSSSNGGFKIVTGSLDVTGAVLEITYQGTTTDATPSVTNLQAIHHDGQTFITWKEIDEVVMNDNVMLDEMENAVTEYAANKSVRYRVYRSAGPITASNLKDSELIREVPAVVSSYNIQSIPKTEFVQKDPEGKPLSRYTTLLDGLRRVDYIIPRYSIEEAPLDQKVGEKKEYNNTYDVMRPANILPRHTGLAVITARNTGSYYYAVVPQVNGREVVSEMNASTSLVSPVQETVTDPAPVSQYAHWHKSKNQILKRMIYWMEKPYSHIPQTFLAGVLQPYILPQNKLPLYVHLDAYGGGADQYTIEYYNVRNYLKDSLLIEPPSNPPESMWQGYHEGLKTLKGFDDGAVSAYPQARALLMEKWAKKNFSIDEERTVLGGQFSAWGLRRGDEFSMINGDAYGNFKKGIQMQNLGKSGYWGPYPEGGDNENGANQWDWMDISSWLINNPKTETPFFSISPAYGSHVGDMGWAQIPEMYRALAQSKRPFAAYFGSSNGSKIPLKDLFHRIQKNQSLPAFRNGSLDDIPWPDETEVAANGIPREDWLAGRNPSGMINGWLYWEPETIKDEANIWEMTMYLPTTAPQDTATADMTPRRLQNFKVTPGLKYKWQNTQGGTVIQSGIIEPDTDNLLTIPSLIITKTKNRVSIIPTSDAFPSDTISPSAVNDLAGTISTPTSVTIAWTAPGDDENTGTASLYDLRYHTSPINNGNWDSAKKISEILTPQVAGSRETYTINNLSVDKTYYFAIKTIDEWSNISSMSNIASFATQKSGTVISADINQDGKIDNLDFDILKQNYQQTGTMAADINQDGIVDTRDLGVLMSKWGR